MSFLYNLYRHPTKGSWGFSAPHEGKVRTAFVDARNQAATLSVIEPLKLAPTLSLLLRGGYSKVTLPHYLHLQNTADVGVTGTFVTRHPDLGDALGGELVLFAAVPAGADMRGAVTGWEERLSGTDSTNDAAREQWLLHCAAVTCYVPAMSHDPHGVLLLAQWAREAKLITVAARGSLPPAAPQDARHEWRDFLTMWFETSRIDDAFDQLGWPLCEALSGIVPVQTSTLQGGDDPWIDIANQAAF